MESKGPRFFFSPWLMFYPPWLTPDFQAFATKASITIHSWFASDEGVECIRSYHAPWRSATRDDACVCNISVAAWKCIFAELMFFFICTWNKAISYAIFVHVWRQSQKILWRKKTTSPQLKNIYDYCRSPKSGLFSFFTEPWATLDPKDGDSFRVSVPSGRPSSRCSFGCGNRWWA